MTVTAMALVICVLLLAIACAYIFVLRKQVVGFQPVAEYQIQVVPKDELRVIHVTIASQEQRISRFEFVPMFAHHFSDEMLTAVAHAGKPRPVEATTE